MAIQTFDHSGFIVEDIPRAHQYYEKLFGAKPLFIANLRTRTYEGWPIISFVAMGKHRFELCLARHALPAAEQSRPVPRIGFAVSPDALAKLPQRLAELQITATPAPALPDGLGLSECLRFRDPDGNIVELAAWAGHPAADGPANGAAVQVTDVCHVALEVDDLALAEKFYTEALGLTLLKRDTGELGNGRAILKNGSGQVLFLEAVEALSERSLFCGPDPSTAPHVGSGRPHAGAHIAVSVADDAAYHEIEANLRAWKVTTDGDVRAAERPAGELSEYFYDPAGNRLQLIVVS
ncbi:MAG TPA: VOC family protein [Candidatus Lustribacter sp.]|jgi:catechol 2,3-dioxygenase-like lactoylglutathione lyase family enzyme|nr:VOC family protein [Candidatus Lustribacter sp.]